MREPEQWIFLTAREGELPVLVELRAARPAWAGGPEFRHLITLTWSYTPSDSAELPRPEEVAPILALEESLVAALESPEAGALMAIQLGRSRRESWWYARDPAEFMAILNRTLAGEGSLPLSLGRAEDPAWDCWRRLLALVPAENQE